MDRYNPRTRFVLDRLQETSWKNRDRIAQLVILERFAMKGGPKSFQESIRFSRYRNKFPVEWECIKYEIEQRKYTTPEEYRRLLQQHAVAERARREEWEREKWERELPSPCAGVFLVCVRMWTSGEVERVPCIYLANFVVLWRIIETLFLMSIKRIESTPALWRSAG